MVPLHGTQPADQPFDQPRGGQGLPLPLELVAQLVGGTVGDEQQGPHGLRDEYLRGERAARVVPVRSVRCRSASRTSPSGQRLAIDAPWFPSPTSPMA